KLLDDPESVEELFNDARPEPLPMAAMENMQKLFASRAPALLAGSLERMDPARREALTKRIEALGLDAEALQSGKGGDVLAGLMTRLGQRQPPAAGGPAQQGKGAAISLDKGWHGVHYLLCGETEPGSTA